MYFRPFSDEQFLYYYIIRDIHEDMIISLENLSFGFLYYGSGKQNPSENNLMNKC